MITTFCGHSDIIFTEAIYQKLYNEIKKVIKEGCDKFLLGGYGNFDLTAAKIIYSLKESYCNIQSILVIPYLNKKYNTDLYDDTIYPPLEYIPKKFAILKRNEWMVNNSDIIISYVEHNWGGAAKTLRYAEKKNKIIKNII